MGRRMMATQDRSRRAAPEPYDDNHDGAGPEVGNKMEEQQAGNEPVESQPADAELKRPDEAITDLEPEEQAADNVRGGNYFLKNS
jgi:hypothetical protein